MATDWRNELRKRLEQIEREGGPPALGVVIVIPADEMRISGHNVFLDHAGQCNDAPFCGAAAGTLEISFTGSWEKHPQLRFIYRRQPPEGFRAAADRALLHAGGGAAPRIITGIDFGALP